MVLKQVAAERITAGQDELDSLRDRLGVVDPVVVDHRVGVDVVVGGERLQRVTGVHRHDHAAALKHPRHLHGLVQESPDVATQVEPTDARVIAAIEKELNRAA